MERLGGDLIGGGGLVGKGLEWAEQRLGHWV